MKKMHRGTLTEIRGHDIVEPMTLEVIDDQAARHRIEIDASLRRHIDELADVLGRVEIGGCNQVFRRNAGWIFSQGHIGEI